jgi:protein CMS1
MSDSDNDGGVPLIESDFTGGKKRKRNDAEARKAKKNRRNKKPSDIHEDDLDEELGVNLAIGKMDGNLLVNYVARRTKKFEPNMSTVELDDLYLPGAIGFYHREGMF